ncbi:MAG: anti-sigma regulatory factor [Noviherbaspirillum sp.]|jgi:serine/threonine-protein kinase RsbT|nr:anti-sigma regulatory factor [Noviherbaspirillum sp.]
MSYSLPSRRDAYVENSARSQTYPLHTDEDVVRLRKAVRELAIEIGLSLVDQTKAITAASELARNTLRYAGSGEVRIELLSNGLDRGLRVTFTDRGPGIPDLQLALTDGFTSGGGLGLGLGGAKRLVDDFSIDTRVGEGTTVVITKWKR